MALNDISIVKVNGGLGRLPAATDGICGLIATGFAVVGGAQLGVIYRFKSVDDAIAIGFDAEYDTTNGVLIFEHIKEYFRSNLNAELWFILVDRANTYASLFDPLDAQNPAKRLMAASAGTINIIGAVWNKEVLILDLPSTVELMAALANAQLFAEQSAAEHQPVHVILEGKGTTQFTMEDLHLKNAPNVSIMIGQNPTVAETASEHQTYGAIGTLLNAISRASVNENVGYIRKFNMLGGNLQNIGIFQTDEPTPTLLNQLNDFGYIFLRKHIGIGGIYFNDSFTCAPVTDDYSFIENNRTINKAMRLIRTALLPDLNSPINVNPTTGLLAAEVVKKLEVQGKRALDEGMLNQGEISGFNFNIDENQNILSTNELVAELEIIPTGTARKIRIKIGFTNPF